ncbi:hypothetical protein [Salinispora mooreana]|uniref:hypothetical protein n=1 Tax=Salinispora mooreana TaxID=999545 RepID=UPI0003A4BA2E|nr:hypothetical protein [Salinispora mooreana]
MDVLVIGAFQAGLSAGYFLGRNGFAPETGYVLLDAAAPDRVAPGGTAGGRCGCPPCTECTTCPAGQVAPDRPAAEAVADYFAAYERSSASRCTARRT